MATLSISEPDQLRINAAIKKAEKITSGEIRICIEQACPADVLDRAAFIFKKLNIHLTKERNGVLVYLSLNDRKYAIIGDAGIHKHVNQEFWDLVGVEMVSLLKEGKIADALIHVITRAGDKLAIYFPCRSDDRNELSDDIYFGDQDK
jgi:uncharacterized membrane protein